MSETEILLIVEDELSEAVMRKVVAECCPSLSIGERVIRTNGFGNMKASIERYKNACNVLPHVVLTDLDQHACPTALMNSWGLKRVPPRMLFRIAVRSIESWVLADRDKIADYLLVAKSKVHPSPDELPDSKQALVALARKGRQRRLALEICPELGSAARQGPLYNAHLTRFVATNWRVNEAAASSESLARTRTRLVEFAHHLGG